MKENFIFHNFSESNFSWSKWSVVLASELDTQTNKHIYASKFFTAICYKPKLSSKARIIPETRGKLADVIFRGEAVQTRIRS